QTLIGQHTGARPRDLTRHVVKVLDADDRAVKRTERFALFRPNVGRIGRCARGIGIDGETGALALAGWVGDAGQGLFKTVAGGCFAHGHLVTSKSVGSSADQRGRSERWTRT